MPRINRRYRALERPGLTPEQEMELIIGIFGTRSEFADEDAKRLAWSQHGEELTRVNGRGDAWIIFNGGGYLPGERASKALQRIDEVKYQ